MKRTTGKVQTLSIDEREASILQHYSSIRTMLSSVMGRQYKGKRNLYEALGYPVEEELDYTYYYAKYQRQDIASAVIDRPADKTWTGVIQLLEENTIPTDSELSKAWHLLDKKFKTKPLLKKLDKMASLGTFALLLFGFDDVKEDKDFKRAVGGEVKLLYLKAIAEDSVKVLKWEENASNPRYGKPKIYQIITSKPGNLGNTSQMEIHHSRVIHVNTESLESDIYGRPDLHPIINRLVDIEKVLGGDAEMFWRGARPGYTALAKDDYSMGPEEIEKLEAELTKYEHDIRRFITAQGVDIKALEQQVADPTAHLDVQLQAISAQTGIPKRILIGSERGELSSAQDKNEWLALIQTRQTEHAEPVILRPFIDKCMEHSILPKTVYSVLWVDIFAPSEKDKVEIGKRRAEAVKIYSDSINASEILSPSLAGKLLFGMTKEQILEMEQAMVSLESEEDGQMTPSGEELEEEARTRSNGNGQE